MASRATNSPTGSKKRADKIRAAPTRATEEESMETAISTDEEDSDGSASLRNPRRIGARAAAALAKRKRILTPPRMTETEEPTSDGTEVGQPISGNATKKKKQKKIQEIEDLIANIKTMNTVDLAIRLMEASKDVEAVALSSGNLKGTYVKKLKVASKVVEVATEELHKRTKSATHMGPPAIPSSSGLTSPKVLAQAREIAELRAEVARLKKELATEKQRNATASESEYISEKLRTRNEEAGSLEKMLLEKMEALLDRKLEAAGLGNPATNTQKERNAKKMHQVQEVGGPINEVARRAAPQTRAAAKKGKQMEQTPRGLEEKEKRTAHTTLQTETETETEGGWAKVVGRKAKKQAQQEEPKRGEKSGKITGEGRVLPARPIPGPTVTQRKGVKLAKTPPRAAVALTLEKPTEKGYAEVMAAAKDRVDLKEIGIESVVVKRAMTGGLLLEISGPDREEKAAILAAVLKPALYDKAVRVSQPTKKAELRVSGLDDSVTPKEITQAVAREGECEPEEIKCGEIKITRYGLGTAWLRCPLKAAKKLVEKGRIRVGWASAKVQALEARRLQCFRCLDYGHVGARCPDQESNHSETCFRCGEAGHRMAACKAEFFKCPLCARRGCDASHKMGGRECNPPPAPRKTTNIREEKRTAVPASTARPAIATLDGSMAAARANVNTRCQRETEIETNEEETIMDTAPEEAATSK